MACLKNNGTELLRIERFGDRISVRSNGKLLRDIGQGWKRWRLIPLGTSARDWAAGMAKHRDEVDARGGPRVEFRDKMISLFPRLKQRNRVCRALERCARSGVDAVLADIFWDRPPRTMIEILVPLYLKAAATEHNCPHDKE